MAVKTKLPIDNNTCYVIPLGPAEQEEAETAEESR